MDTTDATKDAQEGVSTGDATSGEPGKPSAPPELLTKEQAEKLANERHSKLDRRIAELERLSNASKKAMDAADARAKAAEDALSAAEKAKEESEYESARNNPDALRDHLAKKTIKEAQDNLRKREAELRRKEIENEEAIADAKKYKALQVATDIAAKYEGVLAQELIDLTDGTPEKMEKMAQRLSGSKPPEPGKKTNIPDSGRGKGGVGKYTMEQLENMTEEEYAAYAKERDNKK